MAAREPKMVEAIEDIIARTNVFFIALNKVSLFSGAKIALYPSKVKPLEKVKLLLFEKEYTTTKIIGRYKNRKTSTRYSIDVDFFNISFLFIFVPFL